MKVQLRILLFCLLGLIPSVLKAEAYRLEVDYHTDQTLAFRVDPSLSLKVENDVLSINSSATSLQIPVRDLKGLRYSPRESGVESISAQNIPLFTICQSQIVVTLPTDSPENYCIFSLSGLEMAKGTIAGREAIDASALAPGTYVLHIDHFPSIKFIRY